MCYIADVLTDQIQSQSWKKLAKIIEILTTDYMCMGSQYEKSEFLCYGFKDFTYFWNTHKKVDFKI